MVRCAKTHTYFIHPVTATIANDEPPAHLHEQKRCRRHTEIADDTSEAADCSMQILVTHWEEWRAPEYVA